MPSHGLNVGPGVKTGITLCYKREHECEPKIYNFLDKEKYYLHQFVSKFNRPLYDVFICYGNEEYFQCDDDDLYLSFNAMLDHMGEEALGITSPRPTTRYDIQQVDSKYTIFVAKVNQFV